MHPVTNYKSFKNKIYKKDSTGHLFFLTNKTTTITKKTYTKKKKKRKRKRDEVIHFRLLPFNFERSINQ